MIYLDYTANTPADPDVLDAYLAAERRYIANPNSTHIAGQEARAEMERVTQSIAQHLGVQPAEIIYTSGASEANNLALKGIAHASRHIGKHIISTQLEHSSVGASLSALQQQGYEIDLLDIGRDGRVDLDQLRELGVDLRTNPAIFIGGGSSLFRPLLERSPMVAKADFVEDPKANAIGYEMLAAHQLRS